ncbi:hypothetical protein kac65v162_gp142 [Nodularia phage vB_NspS-kac65v162]|jgi:hypothetical protein|uniref:Uncharacterized protein n=6 Tax=Ravarandavirus TaxID=2843444 RepID=A0A482MLU6_9CAUD|nr:Holliday junction resolvase [Nodularia phage vB_NpeS-2AV2]YP_009844745.1 Holliday junction resolvase [Nodularia phage vB_NspS-kac65v151]YP_009844953.1 Holliday junction resolvase [Nodularia phage vB_NspS-kac68v161]QBQ73380.1 hypothetical protein kac65v161_gp142 [Nodularia phage vB_NspS-kac65v161]QBQ73586.1 hypothetical protein kac65v162_gp142 [Nodularia phage vB_NspS-kac65v162]QBQ73990.1 hypothetical protein kac68v162_gp142 [Nodularia phage vB_NspS-kac68v162]ALY07583.1 hypothetical protein
MSEIYFAGMDSQVNDGWIVILDEQGRTVELKLLPLIPVKYKNAIAVNIVATIDWLRTYPQIKFMAEAIYSFNQGTKGAMTFGSAVNLIAQIDNEPHVDLATAKPQDWKAKWGLTSNKNLSIALAKNMGLVYPPHGLSKKRGGAIAESSNLAESFLLAHYVYQAYLPILQKPYLIKT